MKEQLMKEKKHPEMFANPGVISTRKVRVNLAWAVLADM